MKPCTFSHHVFNGIIYEVHLKVKAFIIHVLIRSEYYSNTGVRCTVDKFGM